MKLVIKKRMTDKAKSRAKKKVRIRKKIYGHETRPRLSVFRSARHIYVQVIDDATSKTIAEASTLSVEVSGGGTGSKAAAKAVGLEIAKRAKAKNIASVVFDRNGFRFHGRIQSLADGAREGGLSF
jgi:large subunit ribosomal protein L18